MTRSTFLGLVACAAIVALAASMRPPQLAAQAPADPVAAAEARRLAGDDEGAAQILTDALARQPSPRVRAELGLALLALGRVRAGEEALGLALDGADDAWIALHRRELEAARRAAARRLARVVVTTDVAGATLAVDGSTVAAWTPSQPVPLDPGRHDVRVTAQGHAPFERSIVVAEGDELVVTAELAPVVCEEGTVPVDGDIGRCCYPAQRWNAESERCEGTPECPSGLVAEGEACVEAAVASSEVPRSRRPVGFLLSLQAGVGGFAPSSGLVFRENDSEFSGRATRKRVPLELRLGYRFIRFLSLGVGTGVSSNEYERWLEPVVGQPGVFAEYVPRGLEYWVGIYLDFHTSRERRPGAIDFFFGGGFEPIHRMVFWGQPDLPNADRLEGDIDARAALGEAGFHFFVARTFALDLVGASRFWMLREYCGEEAGQFGQPYCLEGADIDDLAATWEVRAGFSLLL